MSSPLFVVSEHSYWGEEGIEPLEQRDCADFDFIVAKPTGSPPEIDERLIDPGGSPGLRGPIRSATRSATSTSSTKQSRAS